jgi:hypothetical protein
MEIPDQTQISFEHIPELAFDRTLPTPLDAIAIGWIGSHVPTAGAIDSDELLAIEGVLKNNRIDAGELGCHTCEICNDFETRGEAVLMADEFFVMPQMILHYITVHDYLPPERFLDAVRSSHPRNKKQANMTNRQ